MWRRRQLRRPLEHASTNAHHSVHLYRVARLVRGDTYGNRLVRVPGEKLSTAFTAAEEFIDDSMAVKRATPGMISGKTVLVAR